MFPALLENQKQWQPSQSDIVNRHIFFHVCEEHSPLFSLCCVTVRNTPYAWKPELNIKRRKICYVEPSSVLSPFIESSWGQVINPLCWWMHTLLVDSKSPKKKQVERECCRRPDWFLQVVQIALWTLQNVGWKTCFCITENEETGESSYHHSALMIAYKGSTGYFFSRHMWLLYWLRTHNEV